ncbi:hypothetical protein E2C01_070046 [Portunus trituberculatus]|uniref:Uncharacterized protein n=1 Tax=Portunus trituberculatus TaxID=210409 RepID=A0A5B7I094_PORTR|nr:hypothetical protein [Portunus trituberculatus]
MRKGTATLRKERLVTTLIPSLAPRGIRTACHTTTTATSGLPASPHAANQRNPVHRHRYFSLSDTNESQHEVVTLCLFGLADIRRQGSTARGSWGVAETKKQRLILCGETDMTVAKYYLTSGRARIGRQATRDTQSCPNETMAGILKRYPLLPPLLSKGSN